MAIWLANVPHCLRCPDDFQENFPSVVANDDVGLVWIDFFFELDLGVDLRHQVALQAQLMVDARHGESSCYSEKNPLFERVEVGAVLFVALGVCFWIFGQELESLVDVALDPHLIFYRTHFCEIKLEVPHLLELLEGQFIGRSLEIHELQPTEEISDQFAVLFETESASTPEDIQSLVQREL